MTRVARLILALIVGLAVLTFAASGVVESTVRHWSELDMQERAQLVLRSAQPALADAWNNPARLTQQLNVLDSDQRVIGAAACGQDYSTQAITSDFPHAFSCLDIGPRVRDMEKLRTRGGDPTWSIIATLPAGQALVSAMPIVQQGQTLGYAILVHDLSYVDRRERRAQTFLLAIFGVLALLAFGIPMLVTRQARHEWSLELRDLLRGRGKQS
ncbi:MAG: trehalose-6-phosphate synthase, partial [Acidobacteriota bacterium]